MLSLLIAASVAYAPPPNIDSLFEPTVNLSAVRQIMCDKWMGSGYMIAKNILVTALHVGSGEHCFDAGTKKPLLLYKKDEAHDLALMTGQLPNTVPLKYSCSGYKKDEPYLAYGWTGYGFGTITFRQYTLKGSGLYSGKDFMVGGMDGTKKPMSGMAKLEGRTAPGMSGGPLVDLNGYVHGSVNVGSSIFGIPISPTHSYELKDTILCQQ